MGLFWSIFLSIDFMLQFITFNSRRFSALRARFSLPLVPSLAMVSVVALSNFWAQEPYRINDYFLWASFSYPFVFLVTDCTNLVYGARKARRVVASGFIIAGICSIFLSTPRIAFASLSAFGCSQLLDIAIFTRLRASHWWKAPLFSSILASILDTYIFFSLAFLARKYLGRAWRWATFW